MRRPDGLLEVDCFYLSKKAASKYEQIALENLYNSNNILRTNDFNTTDSRRWNDYNNGFLANNNYIYEYNGKKYSRIKANACREEFTLSNGETYHNGEYVWVESNPVKWICDEEEDIAVAKDIIFAGAQFHHKSNYKGDFFKTDIKKYMDQFLSKELERSIHYDFSNTASDTSSKTNGTLKKANPYNFSFDNVSEEEIIKGAIESGVSVFLHGKSSDGKSARVEQLDPDCEIIYLACTNLDTFSGKSVYVQPVYEKEEYTDPETKEIRTIHKLIKDGEMKNIPPVWYQNVCKKCEKEPGKIHILFLDELTNATPAVQSVAYDLVLKRQVNGIWRLPDNCRIVAAGNEMEDSMAANELAEPLFNRFAHVYINTTKNDWLKWASTPEEEYERLDYIENQDKKQKIHPAIYAYISYRGDEVLRTKYNGITPNADPRKWEMASKVLYQTKSPEMLRALVGEDVTKEFIAFCNQQVITLQDVLDHNYQESDLEMDMSGKYATVVGMLGCQEKDLTTVRNFLTKINPESCAMFDNLWSQGDITRMEKIAELKIAEAQDNKGGKNK